MSQEAAQTDAEGLMSNQATNDIARGAAAVDCFMRPKSVAIVGLSARPDSAGMHALTNLINNQFQGDIHLVGRSGGEVQGRRVLTEIDELPEGIDLAIFTLPAGGVKEAMEGCVRRKVKAVVCFAAGFAEIGERDRQNEMAKIASDGDIALLGPNCFGYSNFIDGFSAGFISTNAIARLPQTSDPKTAILSQSGGLIGHIRSSLECRDLTTAYTISTGNEAGIGLPDFVDFLARDPNTQIIIIYAEEVRDPQRFIKAAKRAREAGKSIIMMHPGRSTAAAEAASLHTGALACNHPIMRTLLTHAGICCVDTIDQLVDTAEVLARFPNAIAAGPGILTFSGALCAIAHDFCEEIGLPVPPLSPDGETRLRAELPGFATPRNPLDLTTQLVWQPDLMYTGAKALLADPQIGSLMISIPPSGPMLKTYLEHVIRACRECPVKPMIFNVMGDRLALPQDFLDLARENKIIVSRSLDRSLRALLAVFQHGVALKRARQTAVQTSIAHLPPLGKGAQPEWLARQLLAAAGVRFPPGDLARTADEAVSIAIRIGFPVAMKARTTTGTRKTKASHQMLLNIADEAAAREAFQKLSRHVKSSNVSIELHGVLVESMAKRGLEMRISAKRDPSWGPVIAAGVGGVMSEAVGDVLLVPANLSAEAIAEELENPKMTRILQAIPGGSSFDMTALAEVAAAIGDVMGARPEIVRIDIDPLVVHASGHGATALDAVMVTKEQARA